MINKVFSLDCRLENDCIILSESEQFILLLMNNSYVSWFILVPKTSETEFYHLANNVQSQVLTIINRLSKLLVKDFKVDKINVASIGNIVEQMHIHIVGRYHTDPYWPGVVWGRDEKKPYTETEFKKIKIIMESILVL